MASRCPRLSRCRRRQKRVLLSIALILYVYAILSVLLTAHHLTNGINRMEHGISDSNSGLKESEFAACLLVMDDSHYLVEWLAYHYHSANLRKLIIVVDPNSQTSPRSVLDRWRDYIHIEEWKDSDFGTQQEYHDAVIEVKRSFGPVISPTLARHRARQRLFYYKCLQTLKQQGYHWTLLTDTDEFVTLNYDAARQYNMTHHLKTPDQPNAVAHFIHEHSYVIPKSMTSFSVVQQKPDENLVQPNSELLKDNPPLYNLQSSPCVQIPRIRFGAKESPFNDVQRRVPEGYNGSDFLTLRWRSHTSPEEYQINKISKAVLDLSRIDMDEIVPVTSIHMPVRSLCQQRRLHLRKSQSFLVIHHYLGSLDQFRYRENDARIEDQVRSQEQFQQQSAVASSQTDDDEIRPWLEGFHSHTSISSHPLRQSLLQGVGQLQPKSWTTYEGDPNLDRCALCFFGLPRSFQSMVLPSIIQNLLIPNARHNCDVYVHFFEQYEEAAGRKNRGGKVDPGQIYLLEKAVRDIQEKFGPPTDARTHRETTIAFTFDKEQDFWNKRGDLIAKFQNTTKPEDGKPMYFPYLARTYHKSSVDNLVKQWHSIEYVFKLMDISGRQMNVQYSRVGMFRSDVFYMTPIDIALLDKGITDSRNNHVVVAGFAQMPVNDRMIYGNYEGVKIWATQRFQLIEERAIARQEPGYVMHSERFLNYTVIPVIKAAGYSLDINNDICFVRTRPDESAMISDCTTKSGSTRGWEQVNIKARLENIIQKNCTKYNMGANWIFVGCGTDIKYKSGK